MCKTNINKAEQKKSHPQPNTTENVNVTENVKRSLTFFKSFSFPRTWRIFPFEVKSVSLFPIAGKNNNQPGTALRNPDLTEQEQQRCEMLLPCPVPPFLQGPRNANHRNYLQFPSSRQVVEKEMSLPFQSTLPFARQRSGLEGLPFPQPQGALPIT